MVSFPSYNIEIENYKINIDLLTLDLNSETML